MESNSTLLRELIKEVVLEVMAELKFDATERNCEAPANKLPAIDTAKAYQMDAARAFQMEKGVLTEKLVLSLANEQYGVIRANKRVAITPLAREAVRRRGLRIEIIA